MQISLQIGKSKQLHTIVEERIVTVKKCQLK